MHYKRYNINKLKDKSATAQGVKMYLYAKPTIAVTQIKGADTEEITRENVPILISRYGLDFASRLIDDLLGEREEIISIIGCPMQTITLYENLKQYIEDEQSASYDVGFEDGQNEGYESGYDDAKNEIEE